MFNAYTAEVANGILFLIMLGVSLNLLMGYAGQMSMAQGLFYGVGAYTTGILTMPIAEAIEGVGLGNRSGGYGWLVYPSVAVATVAAFVFAGFLALPAISRVRGDFLVLLTIAFQFGGTQLLVALPEFSGGPYGLSNIPSLPFFGANLSLPTVALLFLLPVTALVVAFSYRLGESPFGRLLKGIRENESAVQAAGKDTVRPKVLIFALSAGIAGFAGVLNAHYYQFIAPGKFDINVSILVISIVILGGIANLTGTILAAVILGLTGPVLQGVLGDTGLMWEPVVYGGILILLVRFRPQGLIPEGKGPWAALQSRHDRRIVAQAVEEIEESAPARTEPRAADPGTPPPPAPGTPAPPAPGQAPPPRAEPAEKDLVLRVEGLTKTFGGITAVRDVTFGLERGKLTALIGPNGAGKTTIFNMMTSFLKPDEGRVLLHDVDVTGVSSYKLPKLGMARSFQDSRLFLQLNAVQNVAMAVPDQVGESVTSLYVHGVRSARTERETLARAVELLDFVGFRSSLSEPVANLAYGDQKLVAIARLLATDSDVLLFDEPTSGVDPKSVDGVIEVIERVREQGTTICLVEHSIHLVERLADHAIFLDQGTVLATGTVQELMQQKSLTKVYFGA